MDHRESLDCENFSSINENSTAHQSDEPAKHNIATADEHGCLFQDREQASYHKMVEMKLKKDLQFFFMDPVQKWNAKRRVPYKFILQVIKIFLITVQLCIFAEQRYNHASYNYNSRMSFAHLFVKGWDPVREVSGYPPGVGPLAIYRKDALVEAIDFAIKNYANLSNAMGPYFYSNNVGEVPPMKLCVTEYANPFKDKTPAVFVRCSNISESKPSYGTVLRDWQTDFHYVIKVTLNFLLRSIKYIHGNQSCTRYNVTISFDNSKMDGQALVGLDIQSQPIMCQFQYGYGEAETTSRDSPFEKVLNYTVVVVCSISFVLCLRALVRAQLLKYRTMQFFKVVRKHQLTMESRFEFWNFWYIMIIVNDILIIFGSILQNQITHGEYINEQWNICSLLLGIGNLMVWFGVLRYLGFFNPYNVVILTLKHAFPTVMRFLLCAILLYAGFVFCGWLVLGPYHMKFRSISSTSECLFSLINGDDMFATFNILSETSYLLWWFSRIYIYSFTSLFIYVILSLFISVIMDSYETIKCYYNEGFPESELQNFINEPNILDDITDEEINNATSSNVWYQNTFSALQELRALMNLKRSQRSQFT